MVRYPLYVGGFIVLPEPVVRALYLFEEVKGRKSEIQIDYVLKGISFKVAESDLNRVRKEMASFNHIEEIETLEEIIELLLGVDLLRLEDDSFKINYLAEIENSSLQLCESARATVAEIRKYVEKSDAIVDYINTWNLTKKQQPINDSYEVMMTHELISDDDSPIDIAYTGKLVYEIVLLKKQFRGES